MTETADTVEATDVDRAVAELSAAIRELTAAGDRRAAAVACARLAVLYEAGLGNRVAARPWYARAVHLVEDGEPCVEQGWVALAPLGCDVDDPEELIARADFALERARRFGDTTLEIKALADGGLGRVQAGRVADGMAMIDEAMALACDGAADDVEMVSRSVCSFFTACYYTADFARFASWSAVLRQRGLVGQAPGAHAILSSHCDSVQAALLCHLGRWTEAEDVLTQAHAAVEEAMPGLSWNPTIGLAELRLLQGRLAEAEALLLGRDHYVQALLPLARLHLALGAYDLAVATARRGLRMIAADRVRAATLLGVLVEAELGRGELAQAAAAAAELDTRTAEIGLPALNAEAARIRARVRAASGERAEAASDLHVALDELTGIDLPRLRMAVHLDLARLQETADPAAAVIEARAAGALLSRLDVVLSPPDAELLGRLRVNGTPPVTSVRCRVAVLHRDGAWWTASCGDTHVRLRDTKGLRYVAALVASPGVERHALDLVDLVEGVSVSGDGVDRRRLGDAGEALDARSRAAYRQRVAELRDDVDDALAAGDDERAARLQGELDALVAELARAFGLGGRDRRAASAVERARLNVTRALRAALAKLSEALPAAGAVLDRRVRTGTYCAYEPQPDDEALWSVQS
jgi:hypothetical protein